VGTKNDTALIDLLQETDRDAVTVIMTALSKCRCYDVIRMHALILPQTMPPFTESVTLPNNGIEGIRGRIPYLGKSARDVPLLFP
jgi:hypothetical protein